jgi:hypothetical protein
LGFFIFKEKFEFEIQKTPNFEFMSGQIRQIWQNWLHLLTLVPSNTHVFLGLAGRGGALPSACHVELLD